MDISLKSVLSNFGINFGNVNEYPILSNKYFVIIGTNIFSFAKISGINLYSANVAAVNYGGAEEPYLVKEPKNSLNTIRFEKGFGTVNIASFINKVSTMILLIKGDDNSIKGVYYSDRMMVRNVTLSDLNAKSSEVLIQNLEVAYTSLKTSSALDTAASVFGKLFGPSDESFGGVSSSKDLAKEIDSKSKANKDGLKDFDEGQSSSTSKETGNDDSSSKTAYEREQERIKEDTERLKALKEEGLKNSELRKAAEQNKAVLEDLKNQEEQDRAKEQQEIEEKLEKIEF